MLLAFSMSDIINVPFGYLMDILYQLTANYGVALILFAILVKLILLPVTAKSKKSTMKMARLTPRLKVIQKKYEHDPQKQAQMVQAFYKEEGVSMSGGCLWSFVPLLIMIPLYQVVRQPIVYMLHETAETAAEIVKIVADELPEVLTKKNEYYHQMIASSYIAKYADAIKEALPQVSDKVLAGLNFSFLGLDLSLIPSIFSINLTWQSIGGILIPVLSAGSQVLHTLITQKMNNSLVTDEKGVYDAQTAKDSQANQASKTMMWMGPVMSLWIGFSIPLALSLYWLIQGLVAIVIDVYLTLKYRKIYDAEDAIRLKKYMEEEALEAEKERLRAEKRAANPDGITENTSKKKLQKQQQLAEEAAKTAAAKEYAAKKGQPTEEEPERQVLSGIPSRPYCKGRAYDPNRYSRETTEE